MQLDDEICLCFHVTKRKVINFLRVERPRRAAQLSECFGAGTGCGWCRTLLAAQFEAWKSNQAAAEPTPEEHFRRRRQYIAEGRGTPPSTSSPGAEP